MTTSFHNFSLLPRLVCVAALALAGCVSTGSVNETQALTADLMTYKSAQIVVNAADADWQKDASEFKKVLSESFQKKGWWQSGGNGVTFEVTFKTFDKGSKGMRMVNLGGEAELVADVVIKDGAGMVLAQLEATGNSKRQSSTSFGGYDTSWGDSLPGRAVRALAGQIVEYVDAKKKPS